MPGLLKKEVSEQRLRSGSYYIVQKNRIEKYDFGPLHTYIDAEFHGEFIFERFRTIRIRTWLLNLHPEGGVKESFSYTLDTQWVREC